ncbi:unnamed protein product [Allacma fusca]|uniref:Uncharacterized protein n=1 Tax=Allacma fusca TaxID=39272 RepID=A0A8J2PS50_9HEXA|nr:unnamed protein product [Allacma fusca]
MYPHTSVSRTYDKQEIAHRMPFYDNCKMNYFMPFFKQQSQTSEESLGGLPSRPCQCVPLNSTMDSVLSVTLNNFKHS